MIKIIRHKTSLWSGGKTTQLAIYPQESDYTQRNFKWRISSAEVEVEESLFTHLPGFQRLLMILEGEMLLQHEGQHQVLLKPFDQECFDGSWTTRSKGKAVDYNLMLAQGWKGGLQVIQIQKGNNNFLLDPHAWEVLYCFKGTITVTIRDGDISVLEKGDVLMFNREDLCKNRRIGLTNQNELPAVLIQATIFQE